MTFSQQRTLQILHPNGISEIVLFWAGMLFSLFYLFIPLAIIIFKNPKLNWVWNSPSLQKNSQEQINHMLCLWFSSTMPFPVAISSFDSLCFSFQLCSFLILITSLAQNWATHSLSYGAVNCHFIHRVTHYFTSCEVHFKGPLTGAQLACFKYSVILASNCHSWASYTLLIKLLKFF